MSRTRVIAGALLALATAAPAAGAADVTTPEVCVPQPAVTLPCVERLGAGVTTHDVATLSPGTRPVESVCSWTTKPTGHRNPVREIVMRIDSTAPGADHVGGACVFLVDGQEHWVSTSPLAGRGPVTWGEGYRDYKGQQVTVLCAYETTAWYGSDVVTRRDPCAAPD